MSETTRIIATLTPAEVLLIEALAQADGEDPGPAFSGESWKRRHAAAVLARDQRIAAAEARHLTAALAEAQAAHRAAMEREAWAAAERERLQAQVAHAEAMRVARSAKRRGEVPATAPLTKAERHQRWKLHRDLRREARRQHAAA